MKKGFFMVVVLFLVGCSLIRESYVTPIQSPITFHLSQYTPFKNAQALPYAQQWGTGYIDPTPILTEKDLQQAYRIKEKTGNRKISLVLSEQGMQKIRKAMHRMNDVQLSIVLDGKILKTQIFRINEIIPYVITIPD